MHVFRRAYEQARNHMYVNPPALFRGHSACDATNFPLVFRIIPVKDFFRTQKNRES